MKSKTKLRWWPKHRIAAGYHEPLSEQGAIVKIEFLPEGSNDCPLIRLFDFEPSEGKRLVGILSQLADGSLQSVALTEIPGFEPVAGCCLVLRVGEKNHGIFAKGSGSFECILERSRWEQVVGLAEPFCSSSAGGNFQWLDETSSISLLISPTGRW